MSKTRVSERLTIAVLLLSLLPLSLGLRADAAAPPQPETAPGRPVILRIDPNAYSYHLPPPPEFSALHIQSATFNVQFLTAGQTDPFGQPCLNWPDNAKNAYLYAASIWASQIHSTVPIRIVACWANLGSGDILGYGGAFEYYRDFPNAPYASTWYVVALANALSGSDQNGNDPEIFTTYNTNFDWYFGTDGKPPSNKVDFVSVVLHEITHGLGFGGSMEVSGGLGRWGAGTLYPDIYDRFTKDGAGNALINTSVYPNPSAALASALTSNNVWFDGPNANAANGGGRVKLFAPSTWMEGSSYVHLDYNTYRETPNALMIYALSPGTSIHDPGPVTRGILKDLGWPMGSPNLAPSTKTVAPDQANAGQVVTFTVRLVNSGGVNTTVRFTDTLPAALQIQGTPTASSGNPPTVNGQTITWQGVVSGSKVVTITYAAQLTAKVVAVNQAQIDDGLGNIYVRRALVNGLKVFLPLTLKSYRP